MDWPIVAIAALGAAVLGGSVAGALLPEIHPREQRVFRAVNGLPGWLYWPLWGPMQLGNLVVGTVAGLLAALAWGDWRMAVAVDARDGPQAGQPSASCDIGWPSTSACASDRARASRERSCAAPTYRRAGPASRRVT